MKANKYDYIIGIDPGTNTGVAIWDSAKKSFYLIDSFKIHKAIDLLQEMHLQWVDSIFVRMEDARLRKWFGNSGREQLQGAGSIKRDCTILEDFFTDYEIPFELVPPKKNKTKLKAEAFKNLTGWKERTNEHMRDAACLVFGY